ncbi:hypothetical protein AMTR_s00029p00163430 [Amborella trichopoda]|uniref:Uncharacterized protein n=1 Tax=Amborella trichopoda TaxID=13333 RepID=W1PND0_AMBTC|nr:hypothetical protein AMTR_s00029p00163430 [Amborella trichopoda]
MKITTQPTSNGGTSKSFFFIAKRITLQSEERLLSTTEMAPKPWYESVLNKSSMELGFVVDKRMTSPQCGL